MLYKNVHTLQQAIYINLWPKKFNKYMRFGDLS